MTIIWLLAVLAALLLAWLFLARQRLRQDQRALDQRRAGLLARRDTLVAEIRKALPKQSSKLPDKPSAQDMQSLFSSLDKPTSGKIKLLREELVALEDKLEAHPKPR